MSERIAFDELESAVRNGAVSALRKRAGAQRVIAADGTTVVGDGRNASKILSPEARMALGLAEDFDAIAAEIEGEAS